MKVAQVLFLGFEVTAANLMLWLRFALSPSVSESGSDFEGFQNDYANPIDEGKTST